MSAFELEFLGTGTSGGVPLIGCQCEVCQSKDPRNQRLRSSVRIRTSRCEIIIDCGPDFRQQMLRSKTSQIDAILLTHEHMDHVAGLDEVRPLNYLQKKHIAVYCTDRVEERLRVQFGYAFAEDKYPGAPSFELHRVEPNCPFEINGQVWIPILGEHGTWPVMGYRTDGLVYLTDISGMCSEQREKINGATTLVVNALRHEKHVSHFNLKEAIEFSKSFSVSEVFFTHISHQLGLHDTVELDLPQGMRLAYDGLIIKSP